MTRLIFPKISRAKNLMASSFGSQSMEPVKTKLFFFTGSSRGAKKAVSTPVGMANTVSIPESLSKYLLVGFRYGYGAR